MNEKLLDEPADKSTKDAYAERGFIHVPAAATHGGVIAEGGVRRDGTLGLAALRLLRTGKDEASSLPLRRYILGLSLVAFTYNPSGSLRQGCLLVLNPDQPREFVEVHPDGKRTPCSISHDNALKFATEAAKAFGIEKDRTVEFEKDRAKKDVKGEGDAKTGKKKGKGKDLAAENTDA